MLAQRDLLASFDTAPNLLFPAGPLYNYTLDFRGCAKPKMHSLVTGAQITAIAVRAARAEKDKGSKPRRASLPLTLIFASS
jgi:hypothetical protein